MKSFLRKLISAKGNKQACLLGFDDIAFCSANGSYTYLNLVSGKKLLVSKTIGAVESHLKNCNFIRCHNSYLINVRKVQKYNRRLKMLTIVNKNIPVSRRKCKITFTKLKAYFDQL